MNRPLSNGNLRIEHLPSDIDLNDCVAVLRQVGGDGAVSLSTYDPGGESASSLQFNLQNETELSVFGRFLLRTILIEGAAEGEVTLEWAVFQGGLDGVLLKADRANITVVKIESIEFMPTGEGTLGTLSKDNTDGVRNAQGIVTDPGWRFFPDYATLANRLEKPPQNIVQIKVTLSRPIKDAQIFFRSFDVDDPTRFAQPWETLEIDENDFREDDGTPTGGATGIWTIPRGGDNYGSLASQNTGTEIWRVPGESRARLATETNGFAGYLGLAGLNLVFANIGWLAAIRTDANGVAKVDLHTSFAPGDNYRVIASTNRKTLEDLNKPNAAGFKRMTDVPTNGPVASLGDFAKATEQLTVWRRLHVEQDHMASVNTWPVADLTAYGSTGGPGSTWWLDTDLPSNQPVNFYKDGIFRFDGQNYRVLESYSTGGITRLRVNFQAQGAAKLYPPNYSGYADDGTSTVDFEPIGPSPDTTSPAIQNQLYLLMQSSTDRTKNRYADAYIQPFYDTLDLFDSSIAADGVLSGDEPEAMANANVGARQWESDMFWCAGTAVAMCQEKPYQIGLNDFSRELGVVFVSSAFFTTQAYNKPGTNVSWTMAEVLAWTMVHEVGHQFNLGPGGNIGDPEHWITNIDEARKVDPINPPTIYRKNIMMKFPFDDGVDNNGMGTVKGATDSEYYFINYDVVKLRSRRTSPGTPQ